MTGDADQAIFFYSRHPISVEIIRARLIASRGDLAGLRPEELFAHDQDHYGGIEANDALARDAGMARGMRVADFCAGLGGPARYFARRYGVDVTGVDLTPARVAGANELSRLVGLADCVRIVAGNVMAVPLEDEGFDLVVSQEALLHVPDRRRAIREAFRILRTGGRLAFTDLVAHGAVAADDAKLLWDGMAVQPLESPASYRRIVADAGFTMVSEFDRTEELETILTERLAMYQKLRTEAERAGTPAGHDAFHRSYVRFVELVRERILGGIRIVAAK